MNTNTPQNKISTTNKNVRNHIETLVTTGLMTALVAVVTMVIPIPVPFTGGYIHLGDSMIFLSVIILGYKYGAFASGVGSCIADLLTYPSWAPFTLVIKGLMALVMGLIIEKCKTVRSIIIACVSLSAIWIAFNIAVRFIISHAVRVDQTTIVNSAISDANIADVSEFGAFIISAQTKILIGAFAIPVILFIIFAILNRFKDMQIPFSRLLGMTAAGLFMIMGYYLAGGIMLGGGASSFAVAAFSIPFNIIQFVAGIILGMAIAQVLSKTRLKEKLN